MLKLEPNLKLEIKRKYLHLFQIWIVILYALTDKNTTLLVLFPFTFLVLFFDSFRKDIHMIGKFFNLFSGKIMRPWESDPATRNLTGASYLLMGALVTTAFFDKDTAIIALLCLILSDSTAAIIGKYFTHIRDHKTLAGSFAFFFTSLAIIIIYPLFAGIKFNISYLLPSFFGIIMGTLIESQSNKIKINDNLLIPLAVGGTIALLKALI